VEEVGIICDNSGIELILDLVLVHFLLTKNLCKTVCLNVKQYPTFVSDTIVADFTTTVQYMLSSNSIEISSFGASLKKFQVEKRLTVVAHSFWNSFHFFNEIPQDLQDHLSRSSIIIIKGDANYRRVLRDAHLDPTTPFFNVVSATNLPKRPILCLRTLKSNVIVGLASGQAESLDKIEADWRVNGKRGILQFTI